MIEEWLNTYGISTREDLINAKREIMQEVALAGLSRGGFFNEATFYGGTALRIFYNLDRYSEDLDFSLNYKDDNFSLEKYFDYIKEEFALLNLEVSISIKKKRLATQVESAFLKESTVWGLIKLDEQSQKATNFPISKIKIEVDKTPSINFQKENLVLSRPYSFYVTCMKPSSLFSGKMHAVLFRSWGSRVKGRDWYDMEWYISRNIPMNLEEFNDRALNSSHLNEPVSKEEFKMLLSNRIDQLDIMMAKNDISVFIANDQKLKIWSKQYFHDLVKNLKIT